MIKKDIEFELDRQKRESNDRVKALLQAEGRFDLVEEFDQRIRDLNLGVTRARSVWHSISPAQRSLLALMMRGGVILVREGQTSFYDLMQAAEVVHRRVSRLPTVRSLLARDLLACEGGAFDPEAVVVLTENARFVFTKGQDLSAD
jgi:hypothetical protein